AAMTATSGLTARAIGTTSSPRRTVAIRSMSSARVSSATRPSRASVVGSATNVRITLRTLAYAAREYLHQCRVAERDDPADAGLGHGEHGDTVGLVGAELVPQVTHHGGLPVGAGRHHPPAAWRHDDMVPQGRHAGPDATEPGAEWRRLQCGVPHQQSLQGARVGVFERRDVPFE